MGSPDFFLDVGVSEDEIRAFIKLRALEGKWAMRAILVMKICQQICRMTARQWGDSTSYRPPAPDPYPAPDPDPDPRYRRSVSRSRSPSSANRDRYHSHRSASRRRTASQGNSRSDSRGRPPRSRPPLSRPHNLRSASRPPLIFSRRAPAPAVGLERDITHITDVPPRRGIGQYSTSRLTVKSLDYPGAFPIRAGLPTRTVVNRDAVNSGPGPGQGIGKSMPICKKYNTRLCRHSHADCKLAHVCFHCVDWEDRHGAWACLASQEKIERMHTADTLRGYRAT